MRVKAVGGGGGGGCGGRSGRGGVQMGVGVMMVVAVVVIGAVVVMMVMAEHRGRGPRRCASDAATVQLDVHAVQAAACTLAYDTREYPARSTVVHDEDDDETTITVTRESDRYCGAWWWRYAEGTGVLRTASVR